MTERKEHGAAEPGAADLLTKAEFADELQVSVRTVERYIADGVIAANKLPGGRLVRISRTQVAVALGAEERAS